MAKQRYINTRFWDDSYIVSLTTEEKLLFIYLLTNPLTNIAGIYEITLQRISFDTGYPMDTLSKAILKFSKDKKIYYEQGYIIIANFTKHQDKNPKINQGISLILAELPQPLLKAMDSLSIPYIYPLNYSNTNSNYNSNNNTDVDLEINQLKRWNENQSSPITGFEPKNIIKRHGLEKVQKLRKKYGSEDNGFSLFLKGLNN